MFPRRSFVKGKYVGLFLVVATAAALIAFKLGAGSVTPIGSGPSPSPSGKASVLLVAYASEAGSADACGTIFEAVRAAGAKGVSVREIEPNGDAATLQRYHVMVVPTVLVLDATGRETARFEGESQATVAAITSQMQLLTGGS
jgi:hypothetical protein